MEPIEKYILRSKDERQLHLRLDSPCIERGGMSSYFKGLLAHILNTTIPSGRKIHLCHACHNAKCSNPNHLYWGTPSENKSDAVSNGKAISPYHSNVRKHGVEEANRRQRRPSNQNAISLRGRKKSEDHKEKIRQSIKEHYHDRSNRGGRHRSIESETLRMKVAELGFKEASKFFGISESALKGRFYRLG